MRILNFIAFSCLILLFNACSRKTEANQANNNAIPSLTEQERAKLSTAVFASGCFWCTEAVFERVKGVMDVVSGYAGGDTPNPTYQEVSAGRTNYAEAVKVYYDPKVISYQELLEVFFGSHDPTQLNKQGPDVGKQYRSAVFYDTDEQKAQVKQTIEKLQKSGKFKKSIVTTIEPLRTFYKAEDYHQDYYRLNPDDLYIRTVSKPKVEKFEKEFKDKLKDEYNKQNR